MELALAGVNVLETGSCVCEYILYVEENDLKKAFDLLYDMTKNPEDIMVG